MLLGVRALVVQDGKVLLVRHTYLKGWYLPGGGIDKGEAPLEALRRELREECSVGALSAKIFGVYLSRYAGSYNYVTVFVVDRLETLRPFTPNHEIAECGWFEIASLPSDVSRGTRARIQEFVAGEPTNAGW